MADFKYEPSAITNVRLLPFTGGLFVIYAFFWPVQYGQWLGSIVGAFKQAAGF